jgi:hypothetical protein
MNQGILHLLYRLPQLTINLEPHLAKSNVVNQNRPNPGNPPQAESVVDILNFTDDYGNIINVEFFLRNFAALGQCGNPLELHMPSDQIV